MPRYIEFDKFVFRFEDGFRPFAPESSIAEGEEVTFGEEGPFPVEPDGGIGDGAGPIDGGPFPVEPDGGIGDGAGPIDGGPFPVEPDGGIGDGAGPIDGGPFPVEPDGGIGDGAGPIEGGPFPIEPEGGIGDGAGPIGDGIEIGDLMLPRSFTELMLGTEEADTFTFYEGETNFLVLDYDTEEDTLDISTTAVDFENIDDLLAATQEVTDQETGEILGVVIDLGNEQSAVLDGISIADFDNMAIIF